jgi:hypothetical protein
MFDAAEWSMKALPKTFLSLTLFGIAVTSLFCVQRAQAFTMTLEQVGSNVVATGSGAINLTGLSFPFLTMTPSGIQANIGYINTGTPDFFQQDAYSGFTGPTSFGSGGFFSADAISGDIVGIDGLAGLIFVPEGYVSGAALSDSITFNNATLANLGVTPGTYVWTWGAGLPNQNFTLIIGGVGVPDGGSTVSLLGCALVGLAAVRRILGF